MISDGKIWVGSAGDKKVYLYPEMANRHGLIAGASGTGKTVTLKVLVESFLDIGVPVFVADIKGDGKGMAPWVSPWNKPWPSAKGKPNMGWGGKPISLGGVEYGSGVGTEASVRGGGSLIQCEIPAGATHFVALAGVDDNTPVKGFPVEFKVEVDGAEKAATRPLSFGETHLFAVPLPQGAKTLKLFTVAEQPVHASWAGAGFVLAR